MPNCNVEWLFDPGVFVDDDGQAYLYFGGGGPGNARVIKLNSDMISVSGSAVTIDAPRFFEAAYMHKRNGIYYFSYSTDFSEGAATIDYMTSSNPMTGFQHRGTVLPNPWSNLGNNNHHSILEYGGQWYIFYHNRAVSNSVYQRSVCLDELYYNSDGTIQVVNATQAGVGPITPPVVTPTPLPTPTPNGNIIVRAMGTQAGANLELHVNGNVVASWTLTTTMADYYANGTGGIQVHFTNDDNVDSGLDVQVDYLQYNGTIYQAEDQAINTAVWQDDSCGGSYSDMMHCNGYIEFSNGGPEPTQPPTPPADGRGLVSFGASTYSVAPGSALNVDVLVNTGTQDLAAYGITLGYDASVLSVNTSLGTNGVTEGAQGFISAVNSASGSLIVSGFETNATGPGESLHLLTIHFSALSEGSTDLSINVTDLADSSYTTIGNPVGGSATVNVSPNTVTLGDVNNDGIINIVDALMTAQYYVDLSPQPFDTQAADVDCNGTINIVDALIIAQYYVGLINSFPC
jgi:hypothetical protein